MKNSKPRRILIVSYDFPPKTGGVATCSHQIGKNLKNQCEVRIISPAHIGYKSFDRQQALNIKRVLFSLKPHTALIVFMFQIIYEIIVWRPNAIINLLWFPDALSTLIAKTICFWVRVPYFVFAHGVEVLESKRGLKKRIRSKLSFLKKWVFHNASGIWAVSEYTKKLIHSECGVSLTDIVVINNGIDCSEFYPTVKSKKLEQELGLEEKKVFLSVARLDDYKGIDQTILAVKKLCIKYKNLIYLVVGAGPDRRRLEKIVAENGLQDNVKFLGKIKDEDLLNYYNLSDCFILLSREDRAAPNVEGFGIVLLEAAACSKPVIAGASGGISDAVENGYSGWLVNPIDTNAIADQMERIINDKELALKIGANGLLRAKEQFSWNKSVEKIVQEIGKHVRN